jgi:hypothetical protein
MDENDTTAAPKAHETPLLGASHFGGLPHFCDKKRIQIIVRKQYEPSCTCKYPAYRTVASPITE